MQISLFFADWLVYSGGSFPGSACFILASTESSAATWACALNTQSSLWWDWNHFVRKLIKVGSLGENAKNKKYNYLPTLPENRNLVYKWPPVDIIEYVNVAHSIGSETLFKITGKNTFKTLCICQKPSMDRNCCLIVFFLYICHTEIHRKLQNVVYMKKNWC
jgi:hypothetical protein